MVSWSDTQVVAAVASGAVSGIARVQQNGAWSNAVGFTVPVSGGNTVTPAMLNMEVGDTHTVQAVNSAAQPVTGLTWTSSDTNIVSLSTDDPPILTAMEVGHVTIRAGSGSVNVTVSPAHSLTPGTVLWSNPGNGSGVTKIVPAVPSMSGVADIFAFQADGTVEAITSDGVTAWTADASGALNGYGFVISDFQGGLVVVNEHWPGYSIAKLDGITGQQVSVYSDGTSNLTSNVEFNPVVVHPDGTIFALSENSAGQSSVIGIDPTTGASKFSVTVQDQGHIFGSYPGLFIAGDGWAYVPYAYKDASWIDHIKVLRVDTSGANSTIGITDVPGSSSNDAGVHAITNADQGILLTWEICPIISPPTCTTYGMATVNSTSVTMLPTPTLPGQLEAIIPVLQAQDGSFIGTAQLQFGDWYGDYIIAFDTTGTVRWTVPNDDPQITAVDGGIIGQSGIKYDQNGRATGMTSFLTQSWVGNEYSLLEGISAITAPPIFREGSSFWSEAGGNPSRNGTAFVQCPCVLQSAAALPSQQYADTETSGATRVLQLPPPPPPPTYLILEGDPGLNLPGHVPHNVGSLFHLSAGTEQDKRNGQGSLAGNPTRVSSIEDFEAQLVGSGPITGGLVYFGHGAQAPYPDGTWNLHCRPR